MNIQTLTIVCLFLVLLPCGEQVGGYSLSINTANTTLFLRLLRANPLDAWTVACLSFPDASSTAASAATAASFSQSDPSSRIMVTALFAAYVAVFRLAVGLFLVFNGATGNRTTHMATTRKPVKQQPIPTLLERSIWSSVERVHRHHDGP